MCGIAGVVNPPGGVDQALVSALTGRLEHRGPDDSGVFLDIEAAVGLGHRRLSILDLSPAGRQPMSTPDGRLTIVLNGEIFNYVELRNDLEQRGIRFRTATDTEVLLEAIRCWGLLTALQRSVGMFAFALYDREHRELILARDRVGEKPLTYFWDGQTFAFASELKALAVLPGFSPTLDPGAVDAYFALGYVPAPYAVFRNCYKLQPGHYLRLRGRNLRTERYWFPENAPVSPAASRGERLEQLRSLVADAVRIRMRSDVPITLYLSGGVDSSVIAAECARQGHTLKAHTVVFDSDETDLPYAVQVAERLGMQLEAVWAAGDQVVGELAQVLSHYDEPFADSSCLPSFHLARRLRGEYKVVLTGDGGDEAFAGYRHYEHIRFKQALKALAVAVGLRDGSTGDPLQTYFQSKAIFRRADRQQLMDDQSHENGIGTLLEEDPFLSVPVARDPLRTALLGDRHVYLPNDLTFKADIALAASGIEGRAPFLDHRILEWAERLPADDLVRGSQKKILLREAYRNDLPPEVLDRPKHGFGAPVSHWLQTSLRGVLTETLPCSLFDRSAQTRLLESYCRTPRSSASQRVWALLFFALWANRWRASW